MEDKENKNTLSSMLIQELKETFLKISQKSTLKVIVIHGYDNYFCCGGTKDELIELSKCAEQRVSNFTFEELNFFDLFLNCEIPVIAAMQGHAIGAGLSLGCFADFLILGEESIYNAIFMRYGFTPGMGATYIIPKKFGSSLGNEMLFTAQNYYGKQLKDRGAPVQVVKRGEVIQTAMDLAIEMAQKSRLSLELLKKHLNHEVKKNISEYILKEKKMHQITFAQPDIRDNIEQLFGN
ncbi:enoyl-CoA hydratase [Priestia aryabhattai]